MPDTKTLRGWCIYPASKVIHYVPEVGELPMCGASGVKPERCFIWSKGITGETSGNKEKCRECTKRHYVMWRDNMGTIR